MTIKAFIFDLDGTLIDAFPAYEAAFEYAFESVGRIYRKGMLAPFYGQVDTEILRKMLNKETVDSDIRKMAELKRNHYLKIAHDHIRILPCAARLIKTLKSKGMKIAIASSGQRSATEIAIDKLNIRDILDASVTGTDVINSKPDPEIFQKAREQLKTPPEQCAVLEDSLHGIEAAKRAGMLSIAVTTGKATKEQLSALSPGIMVESLCELIPKIDEIIK
ncbi:MAG: HAD family phosphatase [archaeon]